MRFRNIFSRDEIWPEARYIVIEHQTPQYLWQRRHQQHENGALELVAVTFVPDEPAALLSRLDALGAVIVSHTQEGVSARLPGRGLLHVVQPEAFADAFGHAPGPRPAMHALTVAFADLARTLALLESRRIAVQRRGEEYWVGPEQTNGFVMQLVQQKEVQ
jgi:hypothetical protein